MTVVTSFVCARSGGGGGMLFGYQTSTYPFLNKYPVTNNSLELVYYGGISTGVLPADGYEGFFGLLQEVTIELGFPIIRWFMPTLYAGYQIAGNLIPGVPFDAFFSYTPVVGFRLQWGSFY